jgi:hypothetical protein
MAALGPRVGVPAATWNQYLLENMSGTRPLKFLKMLRKARSFQSPGSDWVREFEFAHHLVTSDANSVDGRNNRQSEFMALLDEPLPHILEFLYRNYPFDFEEEHYLMALQQLTLAEKEGQLLVVEDAAVDDEETLGIPNVGLPAGFGGAASGGFDGVGGDMDAAADIGRRQASSGGGDTAIDNGTRSAPSGQSLTKETYRVHIETICTHPYVYFISCQLLIIRFAGKETRVRPKKLSSMSTHQVRDSSPPCLLNLWRRLISV